MTHDLNRFILAGAFGDLFEANLKVEEVLVVLKHVFGLILRYIWELRGVVRLKENQGGNRSECGGNVRHMRDRRLQPSPPGLRSERPLRTFALPNHFIRDSMAFLTCFGSSSCLEALAMAPETVALCSRGA